MVEEGAFRARKWYGFKLLSMALKSRVHMMSYPMATYGHLIVIPIQSNLEKDSINEKGLVVETSAQSINRKHGNYG
jgi:hypothetical protein